MRKHKQHITKLLTAFMLLVFAIALTPWSLVHSHNKTPKAPKETNCHHLSHVESHSDNCLICAFGFEKNFVQTHNLYNIFLSAKIFNPVVNIISGSFVEIKHACLRGPPLA